MSDLRASFKKLFKGSAMIRAGESGFWTNLFKSAREGSCIMLHAGKGAQFRKLQINNFLIMATLLSQATLCTASIFQVMSFF